jgi:hypothetical protein
MDEDNVGGLVRPAPVPDILTLGEIGALGDLPLMTAAAQVAVNRQPFPAQVPGFTPPPTGRVALVSFMISAPEDRDRWRCDLARLLSPIPSPASRWPERVG